MILLYSRFEWKSFAFSATATCLSCISKARKALRVHEALHQVSNGTHCLASFPLGSRPCMDLTRIASASSRHTRKAPVSSRRVCARGYLCRGAALLMENPMWLPDEVIFPWVQEITRFTAASASHREPQKRRAAVCH